MRMSASLTVGGGTTATRGRWAPSRPRSSYSELPQSNFHLKGRRSRRPFFLGRPLSNLADMALGRTMLAYGRFRQAKAAMLKRTLSKPLARVIATTPAVSPYIKRTGSSPRFWAIPSTPSRAASSAASAPSPIMAPGAIQRSASPAPCGGLARRAPPPSPRSPGTRLWPKSPSASASVIDAGEARQDPAYALHRDRGPDRRLLPAPPVQPHGRDRGRSGHGVQQSGPCGARAHLRQFARRLRPAHRQGRPHHPDLGRQSIALGSASGHGVRAKGGGSRR